MSGSAGSAAQVGASRLAIRSGERLGVAKVVQRDALSMDSLAEAINAALTDPAIAAESRKTAARSAAMSPATESARLIEAAFG